MEHAVTVKICQNLEYNAQMVNCLKTLAADLFARVANKTIKAPLSDDTNLHTETFFKQQILDKLLATSVNEEVGITRINY